VQTTEWFDLSLAKNLSGSQVIDLSAPIRPLSQLNDHSPAPPASASPFSLAATDSSPSNLALRQQIAVYKRR
jgi:hypothetical protein